MKIKSSIIPTFSLYLNIYKGIIFEIFLPLSKHVNIKIYLSSHVKNKICLPKPVKNVINCTLNNSSVGLHKLAQNDNLKIKNL